jgi:4-hydroxy-tetrahydrodipicolinate synthase
VNPYYNKPTQAGLYRHFMTLAEKVDLPIVLYNIPGRTNITMTAQTVARLRNANPNFIAIKEASGSMDLASEIRSLCDISIFSGDDSLTIPLIALGASGVISVLSNLIPDQIKTLATSCLKGDFPAARAQHNRLYPLMKSLFLDGNPVGIKYAMKVAGLDTGELRLPLWEASESTQKQISDLVRKMQ